MRTDVDNNTANLEAELDAASVTLTNELSQLVSDISDKVASNDDVTSMEAVLETKGLKSALDGANNMLPTKRDVDPTITRTAVDALLLPLTSSRNDLSNHAATEFAETATIDGLRSDADDKIEANRVYTRDQVDSQIEGMETILASKADVATTATEDELENEVIQASPVMPAKGDRGCTSSDANTVKYNPATRKFEVCSQGTVRHHWRPVGSTKDCVTVNKGKCTRCDGGMAVSRQGECVIAGEVVHLDLDNDKVDQAPHANTNPPTLNNIGVSVLPSQVFTRC